MAAASRAAAPPRLSPKTTVEAEEGRGTARKILGCIGLRDVGDTRRRDRTVPRDRSSKSGLMELRVEYTG